MPNVIPPTFTGITGTDGKVAVYDHFAPWHWWNMKEIYTGGPGLNRYIPKIGDYVEDSSGSITMTYEVVDLDPTTFIPELKRKYRQNELIADTAGFIGSTSSTYRVYLNTAVTPHILAVDARLAVFGSMTSYAKIFLGTNVGPDGKCISFLYDNAGNFLTQNIPLELADPDPDVIKKIVRVCHTNQSMRSGELVTVVIYDDNGTEVCREQLIVINTTFTRQVDTSQKYISEVTLESPFLSENNDKLLEFPLNTPVDAFNMIGVVHYSDGSVMKMPVDQTKFSVFGLEDFISTVVGQKFPISLSYTLSPGEVTYNATTGEGKYITAPYEMMTINQNGAFTVKLYCYPVWVDAIVGYQLKWFLYNLDRNISYDVTGFVHYNADSDTYNGKAYGLKQNLSVYINLRDVTPVFKSFIFNQTFSIVLKETGTARTTNWTIAFEPNQDPLYGVNMHANARMVTASNWSLKLDSGISNADTWLERLFYDGKPLIDYRREIKAPKPNFFAVVIGTDRFEFPINMWNQELSIGRTLNINGTIFIEFFRREAGVDIVLGMGAMPIYEL